MDCACSPAHPSAVAVAAQAAGVLERGAAAGVASDHKQLAHEAMGKTCASVIVQQHSERCCAAVAMMCVDGCKVPAQCHVQSGQKYAKVFQQVVCLQVDTDDPRNWLESSYHLACCMCAVAAEAHVPKQPQRRSAGPHPEGPADTQLLCRLQAHPAIRQLLPCYGSIQCQTSTLRAQAGMELEAPD